MTDLETLLRTTLAGRAETVTSGARWAGPGASLGAPGPSGNRRRLAVAAAAAAVIAVGAGVAAVRAARDDSAPPASPTPSASLPTAVDTPTHVATSSPAVTATTPPPPAGVTQLPSCVAALPAPWSDALQNSVVNVGGRTTTALAVAPDKSLVALRDDGVTPGSGREVVYVAPSGATSVVYRIKDPDLVSVQLAEVSGSWLVLGLWDDPRPPKNTEPGNSAIGLRGIVVVNLENLSVQLVAGSESGPIGSSTGALSPPATNSFAVEGGVLYWDEEKHYGDSTGTIKAYKLGSSTTSAVYTGPVGWVTGNAAGVGWHGAAGSFTFVVHNPLPDPVERALTDFSRPRLRSDGTSYAWIESTRDVYWWQPGLAKPVHLVLPTDHQIDTDDGGGYVSVAGHVLVSDTRNPMVIDMRTGAVARFPTTGLFGAERGELMGNSGDVFYGLAFTGSAGHFENGYWADTATSALRVDVSALPELTC